ncbi:MAG: VUT family protein [Marinicaulis sp.]|nr:VUT family protein [Marinicaulis sp.]NNE40493.1 VUT family protein [Marinicaulis sp.]NNL89551.1 VUT family protein [Marinicaulis sp.]
MDNATAVEKHASRETALERLGRQSGEFATAISRMVVLALILTPVLLLSFLTVDLPLRSLDRFWAPDAPMRPSNWLAIGGFIMALAPLVGILITRRYGGDEASRVITAAWGVAAVAVFAELSYLAPVLTAADFPPVRFTVVFVASAMAAQYIAVNAYDVARGGGKWWRAPLYGALAGYFFAGLIYFPAMFWGAGAPWLHWLVGDFAIKAALAFAFLPIYAILRKPLRPKGGFGGI